MFVRCSVVLDPLEDKSYQSPIIGTLVYVPGGAFQRDANGANLSTVLAFRMSKYEITRAQWVAVMGWMDPSHVTYSSGQNDPVQNINWYHAIAFCNKLSLREGLTPVYKVNGVNFSTLTYEQIPAENDYYWSNVEANWTANGYRLPTEMEWMWAAMGADTTGWAKAFAGRNGTNVIDHCAWYYTNSYNKTHIVGTKIPNELGLHDLSGNVWEWVWDWYVEYPTGRLENYKGPDLGSGRGLRGGSFVSNSSACSVDYRNANSPYDRNSTIGFRVVKQY